MRVHVLIGSLLMLASLVAEAGEPIVVLEYGQRGGHEYGDDASTHPFRMDPNSDPSEMDGCWHHRHIHDPHADHIQAQQWVHQLRRQDLLASTKSQSKHEHALVKLQKRHCLAI